MKAPPSPITSNLAPQGMMISLCISLRGEDHGKRVIPNRGEDHDMRVIINPCLGGEDHGKRVIPNRDEDHDMRVIINPCLGGEDHGKRVIPNLSLTNNAHPSGVALSSLTCNSHS
jgi:N-acetylmuramoyl-L-alanine amidase